jgi:hypothetical protein
MLDARSTRLCRRETYTAFPLDGLENNNPFLEGVDGEVLASRHVIARMELQQ